MTVKNPSSQQAQIYLQADSRDLQPLMAKIKELDELNRRVAAYLDPKLVKYCQVANLIGNRLVLLAANGSIATELRFQVADLLKRFKQDALLKKIQDIQCKVRPSHQPARGLNPRGNKMLTLSAETAEIVRASAVTLDDPKLREVMERIAGRVRE